MSLTLRRIALALPVVATLVVALASPSSAVVDPGSVGPGDSGYTVTIAARVCDQYTDVRANRSRDDLMESLQNLGPDTNYLPGETVDPDKEDAAPQDACRPLENWELTLGHMNLSWLGFNNPANPSSVIAPDGTSIVTQASVPELDATGQPTGATVAGATTIELTLDQVTRAARGSDFLDGLWLMGGKPGDQLLNEEYPNEYGFATLRCSNDYLHGDNIEYIQFPEGTSHAFCYAYYVSPPPGVGSITIVKQLAEGTDTQSFPFSGTLSYNPGGRFDLSVVNGSQPSVTYFRGATPAGGEPWIVDEDALDGWEPSGPPVCTATREPALGQPRVPGSSTFETATGSAKITLVAGDDVVCTFTNQRFVPPPPTVPTTTTTTTAAAGGNGSQVSPAVETPNAAVQGASDLPATGSSSAPLAVAGLAFIGAGTGALVVSRRRRTR